MIMVLEYPLVYPLGNVFPNLNHLVLFLVYSLHVRWHIDLQ
jgi:hypothetical protein